MHDDEFECFKDAGGIRSPSFGSLSPLYDFARDFLLSLPEKLWPLARLQIPEICSENENGGGMK